MIASPTGSAGAARQQRRAAAAALLAFTENDRPVKFLQRLFPPLAFFGGFAWDALGDILELERAFKKFSQELQGQYILTYRPANQNYDGRLRKVEVRFIDKAKSDKYKIRTKTSYRAVRDSLK